MVGSFTTKEDAKKKLSELKENGIDGFIVYFENGIKK
jgi:cell division protein FtsN